MIDDTYFLDILVQKNLLPQKKASELLTEYKSDAFEILLAIEEEEIVDKNSLGRIWGDTIGFAYKDLKKSMLQKNIVQKIPEEFSRQHKIVALYQLGNVVTVAAADPRNDILLDKVEQLIRSQVSAVFSFPYDIDEAIDDYYTASETLDNLAKNVKELIQNPVDSSELPSVIPEKTKKYLIESTKEFSKQITEGKTPKLSDCKDIRNTIINEVNKKIDLAFCINQLRIVDEYTYSHSVNVATLSAVLGKTIGLSDKDLKELALGALLHDIGKMKIPKVILNKPDQLSKEEIDLVKRHPLLGHQIVKTMGAPEAVAEVVLCHHERVDGSGYPHGILGVNLTLFTQIVTIVDVYDYLVSDRPKKPAVSKHEAANAMLIQGTKAFNQELLHKFVEVLNKNNNESMKKTFESVLFGQTI